jgi:glycosyltransferase involved in cell wall biosynthesis
MRIGIDARELMGRPTGVGRYLAEILAAWARPETRVAKRHDFVLYGPAAVPAATVRRFSALQASLAVVPGAGGTWWEQVSLPGVAVRDRLDLFFAPAYTAPLRLACPVALTIHDLSYFAHPEWFGWREGFRRRLITRHSARRASVVLTVTACSRSEIISRLGIPQARVRVVYHGAGLPAVLERTAGGATAGNSAAAPREPLILYVGSIFNRRRLPDLIAAFPAVAARVPGARLEIVGENRTHPHQDLAAMSRATGCGDRIRLRSYVTDPDLADAFTRASVFVFLSEYEGFGLTPLEALAGGIPIVVLDTPVAREVYGEAARYVTPGDGPGLVDAIVDLLGDRGSRDALLAKAPAALARYSWPEAARQTMAALESAGR